MSNTSTLRSGWLSEFKHSGDLKNQILNLVIEVRTFEVPDISCSCLCIYEVYKLDALNHFKINNVLFPINFNPFIYKWPMQTINDADTFKKFIRKIAAWAINP